MGQLVRPGCEPNFAHPAERDLARLLTFYGVRWAYEPTTFALTRGDEARPAESFTPDFYLPEHRFYIELTTMRQRLVTRKNRKLRRLRELYPGVGIKLLYRRDYLRLLDAYDHPAGDGGHGEIGQVLYTEEEIAARVGNLAGEIVSDWSRAPGKRPLLVGVGQGSDRFLTALGAELARRGVDVDHDRVEVTRYNMSDAGQRARVQRTPGSELAGRRVLVVEDVVSTGLSLAFLMDWMRRRGVHDVAACTLLNRGESRLVTVPVRHVGFDVPETILAGYGLTLRQQFSDLPYIALVVPA